MGVEEQDPVSGHKTTGHEWNGIKELDTPVPRGVLIFLVVTHIFAFIWWFLMPAWPVGETHTKGLLQTNQWAEVEKELREAHEDRDPWIKAFETGTFQQIMGNEQLMEIVQTTGPRLFGDNCAACHGTDGAGGAGYPDLTDNDWQWGGSVEDIAETMRVGVNAEHAESRQAQMPAFGNNFGGGVLNQDQLRSVATYIYSLSNKGFVNASNRQSVASGQAVYVDNCAVCHGQNAEGNRQVGAPNLADSRWIYGGDIQSITATIHDGRQGHMPTWDERLTPAEIKILALYVHSLGAERQ